MKKKIVSILLALIVLVNLIGSGFFSVRAHAIAPLVAAFLEVAKETIVGLGIGVTAQGGTQVICGISDTARAVNTEKFFQQSISDVTNDNLISARMDDDGYVIFSPSPNCSSESSVLANRLANELNSLDPFYRYVDSDGFNVNISAKAYAAIKNAVTNTYGKTLAEMASGDAVASAAGLTPYDFTFSGPVLPFQMPILTSGEVVGGNIGGYNLSSPEQLNANGNFNEKRSTAFGIEVNSYSGNDNYGYELWCVIPSGVCYNWGMYIVYNGKIYYCPGYSSEVNDKVLDKQTFRTSNITSSYTSFYDVDGNKLNKKGLSPTSYVCGVYYVVDPTKPGRPQTEITVSDISGTEAGTSTALTLAPQRTSAEETVGEGMAIGVIPQDATLTLDDSGNIVKVDGIDLSSIESLLNQLKNGQLDFDSLEAYLSTIQTLLANGNATRSDIDAIMRNLQRTIESSNDQTALINAINTALQAQTAAITDALNPAGEADEDNTIPETLTGIDEKIGNLTDVFSSEGELLSYLESIEANTKAIADSIAAEQEISADKDFDIDTPDIITDKFPFSLPFDIHRTFTLLAADPEAPKFTFPIEMEGVFSYKIVVDLSEYEWIASVVRWFLFIIFVIGLILATNKLIGRG